MSGGGGAAVVVVKAEGVFARALGHFCRAWQDHYGAPYFPTAADRAQLGRLLNTLPRDALNDWPRAVRNYVADLDPYLCQRSHPLHLFCAQGGFNAYRVRRSTASPREARGHQALQAWLAMTEGGHEGQ